MAGRARVWEDRLLSPRVLFVQYTDPAAYPPTEHAALLLARAGCEVLLVGIRGHGTKRMQLRPHERVHVRYIGGPPGGRAGAAKYARFLARVALLARSFSPAWCYASDPLSAPAALLVRKGAGARVVYHEHDAPTARASGAMSAVLRARDRLARHADVLVIPSEGRRALLPQLAQANARVVWNCPLHDEVEARVTRADTDELRLVYSGSIAAQRLPLTYVDVLERMPHLQLHVYGYETIGHVAHVDALRERAVALGVGGRLQVHGTTGTRHELLAQLRACDVGIATLVGATDDPNLASLAGASNKAFDYMAAGLPFLVSDEPQWRTMFVDPDYARACRPDGPQTVVAALATLLDPAKRAEIGTRAQQRILQDWNYETQFAPVLEAMTA